MEKKLNKVRDRICKIFGHTWKYNFPCVPNKRICSTCKKKQALNLDTFEWTAEFVDARPDKELIKKWY